MQIRPQPLTAAAFAPFGQVLAPAGAGSAANAGMARRFDDAVDLDNRRPGARANLALFDVQPIRLPHHITALEQHPHSTQTFIPLGATAYAVAVCAADATGAPDVASLQAFVATGEVGVHYAVGTWHHAIMALDAPTRFASLVWEDGTAGDCTEVTLASPVTLLAPA